MKINRLLFNRLAANFFDTSVSILVGARQVGKTFLLKELEGRARGKRLRTSYFDLEQPEDLAMFKGETSDIIKLISSAGEVVFLDEFHYIKNASQIFKAIYDRGKKVKIFASGSSSIEIHKHLKESLVGRKFIYQIPPCTFSEIGQAIPDNTLDYYLRFGGMPKLIHYKNEDDKKMIISDIVQSYLLKDIKALIREENVRAFNNMFYLLAQYQGSIVPTSNLAREIGVSSKTVESYLEIMAQTFTCFPLHSFSRNLGNELKKSKKYYLYDIGVRNGLLKNFERIDKRNDSGVIFESFVFAELQKQLSPETEIRFWRLKSGEEVDFVWIKNQRPYPIEVKSHCGIGEIPNGLRSFLKRYPDAEKAFIVSKDSEGEITSGGTNVLYVKLENASKIPSIV